MCILRLSFKSILVCFILCSFSHDLRKEKTLIHSFYKWSFKHFIQSALTAAAGIPPMDWHSLPSNLLLSHFIPAVWREVVSPTYISNMRYEIRETKWRKRQVFRKQCVSMGDFIIASLIVVSRGRSRPVHCLVRSRVVRVLATGRVSHDDVIFSTGKLTVPTKPKW